MARKSFSIHNDYYGELSNLTAEQRGAILLALINWASDGDLIDLDPLCAMLFRMMTSQIERISKINSANGSNGGRGNKSEVSEETEQSGESDREQIKPTVSDAVTDTISTSICNISDKTDADKTMYGKCKNVPLSDDEYKLLLSEFPKSELHKKIDGVSEYVKSLDTIYPGFNYVKQIRQWDITTKKSMHSRKQQSGRNENPIPDYTEDLLGVKLWHNT